MDWLGGGGGMVVVGICWFIIVVLKFRGGAWRNRVFEREIRKLDWAVYIFFLGGGDIMKKHMA